MRGWEHVTMADLGKAPAKRKRAKPRLLEKAWQAQVVALAKAERWAVFHVYDSRRCPPGFPDLVLLRGSRQVVAELKAANGFATPEQLAWLKAFVEAGSEAYLWRPENWNEAREVLARGGKA